MADDLRLVRVTQHKVGYLYLTPDEVEQAVTATVIDGDLLLELPGRVQFWFDDYPTTDLVTFDEDGEPEIEEWHELPEVPRG